MAEPKSAGLWANSVSRGAGRYTSLESRILLTLYSISLLTSSGGSGGCCQSRNRLGCCRWGETQSCAPNQPNQIHTTPDTELRRSRTKNPRQTSCIWFNRQLVLLQSSPIKLSSQSLSPKPSEPNSIKTTLILLLLES